MFLVMGEAGMVDDVHGRREIVRRISHDCFNVQFFGRVDHGWPLVLGHPFTTRLTSWNLDRSVLNAPHDRGRGVTAKPFRVPRRSLLELCTVAQPHALATRL